MSARENKLQMNPENKNIDKKRIAKNTLILYVRMFFLMLVGFYTVRLLLAALGVEDYGLYNVIFGLVTAFSFFSGAMQSTVQRFLCYELGLAEGGNTKKVFSVSVLLFLLVALSVLLFAETAGLWFVRNRMSVPAEKMGIALTVYHISVFMVIFKLLQIPYISAITSHEDMRIYSYFSIADAFLHLASVVSLKFIFADRLICFVSLYTVSNLVILILYALYCCVRYEMCRTWLKFDCNYLKSMTAFFSWSLFGAAANIFKQQGLNLLLNLFYGVVLNATWGIATQVGGAVNQFVSSFQQAFNPQILKSYSNPDKKPFMELLQSSSKYSFMLIWLVSLPVLMQTEFLLKLWLGNELPEGAVIFTQLMIGYMLFEAINGPMWIAVQATGKIRRYQIEISCLSGSSFVFSYIVLKFGAPALSVAVINLLVNMSALWYRLFYLRREIGFPIGTYCLKTLLPVLTVAVVSSICGIAVRHIFGRSLLHVMISFTVIGILNLFIILFLALTKRERGAVRDYVIQKLCGRKLA